MCDRDDYDYRDRYDDGPDEDESCGPNCCGVPRHRYCSDRTCGGGDCSTCYGEGVDHDGCPEPQPDCAECGDSGEVECGECGGDGCDACDGNGCVTCPECGGGDE